MRIMLMVREVLPGHRRTAEAWAASKTSSRRHCQVTMSRRCISSSVSAGGVQLNAPEGAPEGSPGGASGRRPEGVALRFRPRNGVKKGSDSATVGSMDSPNATKPFRLAELGDWVVVVVVASGRISVTGAVVVVVVGGRPTASKRMELLRLS